MAINIRRANADDAPLLSQLATVTFCETFRGTCTDDDLQQFVGENCNTTRLRKELEDVSNFYFIASIDNIPVGYLQVKEEKSEVPEVNQYKAIELKRIYVLKEYQNIKAGAALMKFALDFATGNGYEAIWLGVWEHNERAKSFYEKWGFTDTGHTHDFPIGGTAQTDHWFYKVLKQV